MNKVMLVGRLTAKPELKYTASNVAFVRFTVAVNRNFTNNEGKGNLIALEGRLQTGSYDDKDGNKRYTMDVALDNFEFVESKKSQSMQGGMDEYIPEPTPYDYQNSSSNSVNVENDPFAEFGDSVSIDDNFLD